MNYAKDKAIHTVIHWSYRMVARFDNWAPTRSRHPLQEVQELALSEFPDHGVTGYNTTNGRGPAGGVETRRRSSAPGLPINMIWIPENEADRILQHVGLVSDGKECRQILFLWGLGYTNQEIATLVKRNRTTVEKRLEKGFAVVESTIIGRWFSKTEA